MSSLSPVCLSRRHLDLSNNSLTTLPKDSLATAPLLETLILHSNPWSCDCRLNWFLPWSLAHPGDSHAWRILNFSLISHNNMHVCLIFYVHFSCYLIHLFVFFSLLIPMTLAVHLQFVTHTSWFHPLPYLSQTIFCLLLTCKSGLNHENVSDWYARPNLPQLICDDSTDIRQLKHRLIIVMW